MLFCGTEGQTVRLYHNSMTISLLEANHLVVNLFHSAYARQCRFLREKTVESRYFDLEMSQHILVTPFGENILLLIGRSVYLPDFFRRHIRDTTSQH